MISCCYKLERMQHDNLFCNIFSPLMLCMQCTMHKMGSSYERVRPSVRLSAAFCIVAKRFELGSPNLVSGTTSTPKAL